MPVSTFTGFSLTVGDNNPSGTEAVGPELDDHIRSVKQGVAQAARWEQTATASAATTLPTSVLCKSTPIDTSGAAANVTVTLPDASTAGDGWQTRIYNCNAAGDYSTIVSRAGSDTIDGATAVTLSAAYQSVIVASTGSGWTKVAEGSVRNYPAGALVQTVHSRQITAQNTTAQAIVDGSPFTGADGTPCTSLTAVITPVFASSNLLIRVGALVSPDLSMGVYAFVLRDSAARAAASSSASVTAILSCAHTTTSGNLGVASGEVVVPATAATETKFTVNFGGGAVPANTARINGNSSVNDFFGASNPTFITVQEIAT